jgi:hypothetical protein
MKAFIVDRYGKSGDNVRAGEMPEPEVRELFRPYREVSASARSSAHPVIRLSLRMLLSKIRTGSATGGDVVIMPPNLLNYDRTIIGTAWNSGQEFGRI